MIDVTVVGSLHLDIMVEAPRLPERDETLTGSSWRYKCGGKGGNQAVAAAQFGARTAFGGQTGGDDFGQRLRHNLETAGVDTASVETDPARGSGISVAISEAGGEYGAVIVSGANLTIDATAVGKAWERLWSCKVLLLQNEIAEAVNLAAAREARSRGARIVLNAAPARRLSAAFVDLVDILVVNRVEAEMMAGTVDAELAVRRLSDGGRDVILTRGKDGLVVKPAQQPSTSIDALDVVMISSHGAGDFFCGAMAARLAEGDDLIAACRFARTAAGLFVSTPAAQQRGITSGRVLAAI